MKKMGDTRPHVVMIPYPAQGHINPSFSFAESLSAHGLQVTFLTTTALSLSASICNTNSITIHHISDGFEHVKEPETVEVYLKRMKDNLSHNLAEFIDGGSCWPRPRVIIYDSIMPWILDIAHERGLIGASFFTQSCGACAVYYHLKQGLLRFPYDDELTVSLPGLPVLGVDDLPWFPVPASVDVLVNQFLNLERADWIFFNSFDKLESEVLDWMTTRWHVKTVGPTHLLLHKNEEYCNNKKRQGHGINLFEPKQEGCKKWLDSKEDGTVVYVSFGSIASFVKEQMEEVAYGLIMSNCPFLWVVRSSEMDKLPQNLDYSQNGLIVEWCHQPQVLAHPSLACFMSHCGWNSTLEALSHGVPLVAMPQKYDQKTNSKFVEDVWGIGARLRIDGTNGIIGREEIATKINQVVGADGVEIKKNACKWRDLAYEAVGKGGTSANHLQEFVSKLINS